MFFCVLFVSCLVVSISVIDCLERFVPDMTYYVSNAMLNSNTDSHILFQLPSIAATLSLVCSGHDYSTFLNNKIRTFY